MMGTTMQIAEGKIMTQNDKNETPLNLTSEQNKPNTLHHSGTKILSNYHIIHISIYYSKTLCLQGLLPACLVCYFIVLCKDIKRCQKPVKQEWFGISRKRLSLEVFQNFSTKNKYSLGQNLHFHPHISIQNGLIHIL